MASFCPGYAQVDEFGPDEEYEEEEVSYVVLDLGRTEPTLLPSSSTYRLIGLDTPTPFLQLSGTIFKGRHDSLLGTELIFNDAKATDAPDRTKRSLAYVASTEQRVCFNEVRLQPKTSAGPPIASTNANGKGKSKAKDTGNDAANGDGLNPHSLDRMTGKAAVKPRRRKQSGEEEGPPATRKSTRAKGKRKAVEQEDGQDEGNPEDGFDDPDDEMYVDS